MDPIDETPEFDHGGRHKRRRTTPTDPQLDSIVARPVHSPYARPPSHESHSDDGEQFEESQPLLTQPPLPPPPPPPPDDVPPPPLSLPPPPPPPLVQYNDISDKRKSIIQQASSDVFSIESPRDFQTTAIHYLSFHNDGYLSMRHRTADGKSLVPLATAVLRRKVSMILVPLHGLGSDQVEKATLREKGVMAYYLDQHRRDNEDALVERLEGLSPEEASVSCTILFVSPLVLLPDSRWFGLFKSLAKRNLFSQQLSILS